MVQLGRVVHSLHSTVAAFTRLFSSLTTTVSEPYTPPHLHSVLVHHQYLTVYTPHFHSVLVHNQRATVQSTCVPQLKLASRANFTNA